MPINPETLLTVDRIIDLRARDKVGVLDELIEAIGTSKLVSNKAELKEKIHAREREVSTGVGVGIAIPHVKIPSVKDFVVAVGRSREGVDFESPDGSPTHLVIMVCCNNTQAADFLKVLARLVTRLKQPELQRRILDAKSPAEIREMFVQPDGILG